MRAAGAGWLLGGLLLASPLPAAMASDALQPPAAAEGRNLLRSGDFEGADSDWGRHVWSGPCTVGYSTAQSAAGARSMRLQCAADGRAAAIQKLSLPAGHYRLSGRLRGLNIAEQGLWGRHSEILLLGPDNWQHTQALRSGRFGWQTFVLDFLLPSPAELTLYLRLFARGTLWADELSLIPFKGPVLPGVRFAEEAGPTPSACEGEVPICSGEPRRDRPRLSRFAEAQQGPFLDATYAAWEYTTLHGEPAVSLEIDDRGWLGAYDFQGLRPDWQGYDYLSFNLHNDGGDFADFSLEIWDAGSTGYWSRVNWHDRLAPGDNHFRVPLQLFVGERIQTRPTRRLQLDQIRRLVLSFRDSGRFRVSEIRLEAEAQKCQAPAGLRAFDFGAAQSPLMFDHQPVGGATSYAACRGYGLLGNGLWRIEDRRGPDPLWRDWISFDNDTRPDFRVDLEPGEYRVEVYWEDPGYWEWYHNFDRRTVHAEGGLRCSQTEDFGAFMQRYFRHATTEDRPADDTWQKYIEPRYRPGCVFDLPVRDGALELAFSGNSPFAAAVNGLLVYPVSAEAEVKKWKSWQREMRHRAFAHDYRRLDVAAAAGEAGTAVAPPAGAATQIYTRPLDDAVYLNSRPQPGETIEHLAATALRGERVVLNFVVLPTRDLGPLEGLRVSGLPDSVEVSATRVRHLDERMTGDGTVFGSVPLLLEPARGDLPAGISRQFLLALKVGETTAAGDHAGRVQLLIGKTTAIEIPLQLRVEALTLPPSPIRHSVLGSLPIYTGGVWKRELAARVWAELPQILQLLADAGLTALTGPQGVPAGAQGCDNGNAQRYLKAMQAHQFRPLLNTYLSPDLAAAAQWARGEVHAAEAIIGCTQQLYAEHGYQLAWSLFDEPHNAAAANAAARTLDWFAQLELPQPFLSSGFTSLHGSPADAQARRELFAKTGLPFITRIEETAPLLAKKAAGQPWGLYNNFGRWGYGLYGWMLHRQYGLTDISAFALHSMQADHYYPLDGREGDWAMIYTGPESQVWSTLRLERLAQGITDFRYLALLRARVAQSPDTAAAAAARRWLDSLLERVTIENRLEPWSATELDRLRDDARSYLLGLEAEIPRP